MHEHEPFKLKPGQLDELDPDPKTKFYIGGIWGEVAAGQTWKATDGDRLVLQASGMLILYILFNPRSPDHGCAFAQSSKGFKGEVTTYPLIEAARRAAPMAKIAEYEMQFMIGLASACSGVVFAAVIGTEFVGFCMKHYHHFPLWRKAISVTLTVRGTLKKNAPTLYEKLINSTLHSLWKGAKWAVGLGGPEVASNLPEALVYDPKIAGRGAGTIVGKIGMNAFAGRLSALSIVWAILFTLGTKALSAVPGAVKITINDKKNAALEIINALRRAGISLSEGDAAKIIEEVTAHPREVIDSLRRLHQAFESLR